MLLVAAVSIVFTRVNFFAAFPEASIDLRYSKEQITAFAADFLKSQGLSTEGFRNLTLFDPDDTAKTYLERELGLDEANRLMQGRAPVWRWRARWFRPPDKEELRVFLHPSGRIVGFEHVIAEAAKGARLDQTDARQRAEEFLRRQTQAPYRLIEEERRDRPNRYDYVFTWEEEGFRAKDATLRRTVEIHGGRVGRYAEYLYVPEKWSRDFTRLRSKNELYAEIAQAFYLPLVLGAVVILIRAIRKRLLHWRPLVLISGLVAGLMVVNQWNSLPFFLDGMPTSVPYSQGVMYGLLLALGAGVGVFFYVIVAAAAGEPLYRESQPSHLSLTSMTGGRAIRTREFFLATVVGYGFAAAHIAFVVAFYLAGRRFGVWSPQDINYSDFLSTKLPWIYPLTISALASTSEEFWFRLLAIPLLKKYLRSTWAAVLIPAFVWGFLHATYPQQPGYIRGLEVGIIGVAAGFLMLRFGILATLIWHYAVDAIMIGMFLIRAENWYFQLSGWLVGGAVMLPLIASIWFYLKHGSFVVDAALRNSGHAREEPVAAELQTPAQRPVAEPLAPRWRAKWLYALAGTLLVTGAAVRPRVFGDFIEVRLTRGEAQARADAELKEWGKDPGTWRHVTEFSENLRVPEFEYIRRISGDRKANEVVRERTVSGIWTTRYFRPLEKEEWRVSVNSEGRVAGVDHVLDEKAAGADLNPAKAREIAEKYVTKFAGTPVERYRLADSHSEKRDKRTDHTFVWEDPDFRIGEAKARVSVDVLGDEPSGFQRFLKLPEEWLREFQRPRLASIALPGVLGAAGLLLLIVFVKRLSSKETHDGGGHCYHWRAYLAVGASVAGFVLLSAINRIPGFLSGYDTARPLQSHLVEEMLSRATLIALAGFGAFLAALAADVFLQLATGNRRLPQPSAARMLSVFAIAWGCLRGLTALGQQVPGPRLTLPLWSLPAPETYLPAVTVLSQAFVVAVFQICLLTIAAAAIARYFHGWKRLGLLVILALFYSVTRAQTPLQFVYLAAAASVAVLVIVALVRLCAADLLSYGVALFWVHASSPAATLAQQPAAFMRWNGVACAVLAAVLGWAILQRFRPAPDSAATD